MPAETTKEFLLEKIEYQIQSFTVKRAKQKRLAVFFKVSITASAALTTILLGWHGLIDDLLAKNAALILSALVTFLSGMDAYFSPRRLWTQFANTRVQLKALESDLQYLSAKHGSELPEDKVDELYVRFESTMLETAEAYQSVRREQQKLAKTLGKR